MAITNVDSLQLGKILQIAFSQGLRLQISQDFRDFEYIKRAKVSSSAARSLRYMFQTSLNPASIQSRNPGVSGRAFPRGFQPSIQENEALFKEFNATIEIEYNLFDRARKSPEKYAEPLQAVINSTLSSAKRHMAKVLYQDGTGVLGTVASAAVTSPASNEIVFTLSTANAARGHAGCFEYGDILVLKAADGTDSALNTSLSTEPAYWQVVDKSREGATVQLKGLTDQFAPVASISSISAQPTAGDVFYKYGQSVIPNLSSISDYGSVASEMVGLESLAASDGRLVHGVTMRGATAGTKLDAGASAIDVTHIQKVMDKVKIAVGQDVYRWKQLIMSPEAHAALIDSRETDRRFNSVEDNKRGVRFFAYQHGNDSLECVTSEYISPKRIYALPEQKSGDKVLEFHGSDFETVKGEGMNDFHLKVSNGEHVNTMVSYMQSIGVLICKHPAAIARIENFTV